MKDHSKTPNLTACYQVLGDYKGIFQSKEVFWSYRGLINCLVLGDVPDKVIRDCQFCQFPF